MTKKEMHCSHKAKVSDCAECMGVLCPKAEKQLIQIATDLYQAGLAGYALDSVVGQTTVTQYVQRLKQLLANDRVTAQLETVDKVSQESEPR